MVIKESYVIYLGLGKKVIQTLKYHNYSIV